MERNNFLCAIFNFWWSDYAIILPTEDFENKNMTNLSFWFTFLLKWTKIISQQGSCRGSQYWRADGQTEQRKKNIGGFSSKIPLFKNTLS